MGDGEGITSMEFVGIEGGDVGIVTGVGMVVVGVLTVGAAVGLMAVGI
jgi:hypothetical protein